jgi:hypothetical protein
MGYLTPYLRAASCPYLFDYADYRVKGSDIKSIEHARKKSRRAKAIKRKR